MSDTKNYTEEIKAILLSAGKDLSDEARDRAGSVAAYAQERAAHLATLVGQPGFEEALKAERDNVALRAGLDLSEQAKSTDAKTIGVIHGLLGILSKVLAGAL